MQDHLQKLEIVLQRLIQAGLKIHADKSFFGKTELDYLGYHITRNGISPISKKIEAIKNMKPPINRKELRKFIGVINFYRDMWIHRAEILSPLTSLTSTKLPWKWTATEHKSFITIKKILSSEVLLYYPNFSKPFIIHADASHNRLGSVISQHEHPIAFYSRKLSTAQTKYTTTEKELLLKKY